MSRCTFALMDKFLKSSTLPSRTRTRVGMMMDGGLTSPGLLLWIGPLNPLGLMMNFIMKLMEPMMHFLLKENLKMPWLPTGHGPRPKGPHRSCEKIEALVRLLLLKSHLAVSFVEDLIWPVIALTNMLPRVAKVIAVFISWTSLMTSSPT